MFVYISFLKKVFYVVFRNIYFSIRIKNYMNGIVFYFGVEMCSVEVVSFVTFVVVAVVENIIFKIFSFI